MEGPLRDTRPTGVTPLVNRTTGGRRLALRGGRYGDTRPTGATESTSMELAEAGGGCGSR